MQMAFSRTLHFRGPAWRATAAARPCSLATHRAALRCSRALAVLVCVCKCAQPPMPLGGSIGFSGLAGSAACLSACCHVIHARACTDRCCCLTRPRGSAARGENPFIQHACHFPPSLTSAAAVSACLIIHRCLENVGTRAADGRRVVGSARKPVLGARGLP